MAKGSESIRKLKKKIYSKKGLGDRSKKRSSLRRREYDVGRQWKKKSEKKSSENKNKKENKKKGEGVKVMPTKEKKKKKKSKTGYFLIFAALFFIISIGVGYFSLIKTPNFVSPKKVDISISGPAEISGGGKTTFNISVTNNNSAALKAADLVLKFPEGTRGVHKKRGEILEKRVMMGKIPPGTTVQENVSAVFYGKRGESKKMKVIVEYRIKGSNAIFSTNKSYPISIASSPLELSVKSVKEITSGKQAEFTINVSSNSESAVKDVLLVADYPFGFSYDSSNIKPIFANKVWKMGDIPAGGEKTLHLKGKVKGQESEERFFRFRVGTQDENNYKKIESLLAGAETSLKIKRPFLGVKLTFNGEKTTNYIAKSGEKVRMDLSWQNNTSAKILGVQITANLNSSIFKKNSVLVDSGFYNSSQNKAIWNKDELEDLEEVEPGDSGNMKLTFDLKDLSGSGLVNPKLPINVDISARRLSGPGRVPEKVNAAVQGMIKMESKLDLTSRLVYSVGPFDNQGPIPPKAEESTTYTVLWTLTNTSNKVKNVSVSAPISSYVKWGDNVRASKGNVEFDPVGGEIKWNINSLSPRDRENVAFQLKFTPSVSQIGARPSIVKRQEITAFDQFAEIQVRSYVDALDTQLSTDPKFDSNGRVRK